MKILQLKENLALKDNSFKKKLIQRNNIYLYIMSVQYSDVPAEGLIFIENTTNNHHVFSSRRKQKKLEPSSKKLNARRSFTAVKQRDYGYSSKDTFEDILFEYLKFI